MATIGFREAKSLLAEINDRLGGKQGDRWKTELWATVNRGLRHIIPLKLVPRTNEEWLVRMQAIGVTVDVDARAIIESSPLLDYPVTVEVEILNASRLGISELGYGAHFDDIQKVTGARNQIPAAFCREIIGELAQSYCDDFNLALAMPPVLYHQVGHLLSLGAVKTPVYDGAKPRIEATVAGGKMSPRLLWVFIRRVIEVDGTVITHGGGFEQ